MKRYINIYIAILKVNFSLITVYRTNFVVAIFSTLLWSFFSIVTILLLTSKTNTIFGWTREELLLLTAILNIVIGIYRMFFDKNFQRFSQIVFHGELDTVLLKPIDSQFQLSFSSIQYYNIFRILFAIGLTMYLIILFNITVTILNIFFAILLIIVGVSILYSITYALLTLTIWFPRLSNLLAFSEIYTGLIRYPKEMFLGLGSLTFFLIPFALIVSLPTRFLLNKPNWADLWILIGSALVFLLFSRYFWKFALQHYSSASS